MSLASTAERAWWLRALLVLQSPRPVFAALRDDSREAAEARQEPITALVLLAGVAAFLMEPVTGRLLDESDADAVLVAVVAFLAGAFSGLVGYWIGGAAVLAGARGAGAAASYRGARHAVAFAAAPIALSLLVLWPVRLSLYGLDLFRTGGSDGGGAGRAFDLAEWVFGVWALALLVVALRILYRLAWVRVAGALAVSVAALFGLLIVMAVFFQGIGGGA
ncbi:MAG: YIP1 family protein [Actinobacteria bacterium]|nr:YIP1 family protein [Actinomycetota bacterium]